MPIVLNCENEPCPNPVLRCKRLLDEQTPKMMEVIVDNEAAMDNVSRYLASKGMRIDETRKDGTLWTIKASSQDPQASASQAPQASQASQDGPENAKSSDAAKILVFLTSDTMGAGDDTLGSRLMGNFLNTLPELGDTLWRIIMVNGAVKLATATNPAVEALKKLEAAGVSILVCGTCLEFFKLMDQKAVGQVTNMLDVVTSQQVADKIISL
ncbi:selenium metabolism protein YedF [Desulfomicrobium macestii]|uniref:Selenium metabolism protein YedF n=2 Tax=Desulfomicrobium TaxID=898 RepID=A0A8G2C5C0_DESNO|nr:MULTISPECIES: sulfurtransferase-like selenium metabolism protein YedF [Desulfomicrobium]MBE1424734.1 selenium metabolism protein YedF [Desulfomicrobium macestii]SFM09615.1 selenium metabolism protein YedF [Desulfomicrobium norvegicum]